MQVSNLADFDTHAIIGGTNEAENYGVADTPEFYTVMSSTLYRDKVRAMVREVMCNGWDEHIRTGQTDRPLEITLTETEVTFRDFGRGIAPGMMRPIYCIYGGSTKTADKSQNGGFGLGSKAPWTVADHFTVTSMHAGIKSVYTASRGSAESGGKPRLFKIVATPTTESGICVSVPLHGVEMREVRENIEAVAWEGGIRANLNNRELKRQDYSNIAETGFVLTRYGKIKVLYGTVLYPLYTNDKEITEALIRLSTLLGIRGGYPGFGITLYAKPGTIGVTPSRESLSYTDQTRKVILRLVNRAHNIILDLAPSLLKKEAEVAIRRSKERDSKDHQALSICLTGSRREMVRAFLLERQYALPDRVVRHYARRAQMRLNPDLRREFRRHNEGRTPPLNFVKFCSLDNKYYLWIPDSDLIFQNADRRLARKQMKILAAHGLRKQAGTIGTTGDGLHAYASHQGRLQDLLKKPTGVVLIGESRKAIFDNLPSCQLEKHNLPLDPEGRNLAIALSGKFGEKRRKLRADFEAAGFRVIEVASPSVSVATPKPPKEKVKFQFVLNDENGERFTTAPKVFLALPASTALYEHRALSHKLAKLYPDLVLVSGLRRIGAVEKLGAKNVANLLHEEAEVLLRTKAGSLALLVEKMRTECHNHSHSRALASILLHRPELITHFHDDRLLRHKTFARATEIAWLLMPLRYHFDGGDRKLISLDHSKESINALLAEAHAAHPAFKPAHRAAEILSEHSYLGMLHESNPFDTLSATDARIMLKGMKASWAKTSRSKGE